VRVGTLTLHLGAGQTTLSGRDTAPWTDYDALEMVVEPASDPSLEGWLERGAPTRKDLRGSWALP
jgi:hypothetical protein